MPSVKEIFKRDKRVHRVSDLVLAAVITAIAVLVGWGVL